MGSTDAPERRAPCPRDPRHRVEGSRRRRPGRPAGRRAQFRQRGGEFARKDDDARPCADDAMSPALGRGTAATRCSAAAAPAAGAGDTATPRRRDAQRSNTRFAPNADCVDRVAKRWMTLLIDETSATRRADPLRRIPDNRCHPLLNRCHPPFWLGHPGQLVPPTVWCSIGATHRFGWGTRLGAPDWSHPRIDNRCHPLLNQCHPLFRLGHQIGGARLEPSTNWRLSDWTHQTGAIHELEIERLDAPDWVIHCPDR